MINDENEIQALRSLGLYALANRLLASMVALDIYGEIPNYHDSIKSLVIEINRQPEDIGSEKTLVIALIKVAQDIHESNLKIPLLIFYLAVFIEYANENKRFYDFICYLFNLGKQHTLSEHLANEDAELCNIDVHKNTSLLYCLKRSLSLCFILTNASKMTDEERKYLLIVEEHLWSKANEAIGYWKAKLDIMIQNKSNVKKRTMEKEEQKKLLLAWMKTMKPKEYRLRAQHEFKKTERTVLKWLQEIRDEKTPILRKMDDNTQKHS